MEELDDRAGPAVGQEQRWRVRRRGANVQEVQALSLELCRELREVIEARLLGPPVVLVPPVVGERPQVAELHPALPAHPGQLVGPADPVKALVEVLEVGLVDFDAERPDGGVAQSEPSESASAGRCQPDGEPGLSRSPNDSGSQPLTPQRHAATVQPIDRSIGGE